MFQRLSFELLIFIRSIHSDHVIPTTAQVPDLTGTLTDATPMIERYLIDGETIVPHADALGSAVSQATIEMPRL